MQSMQIKYHEEAKRKGIHIVSACGFDSIPADMGLEILREKFPGMSLFKIKNSFFTTYQFWKKNIDNFLQNYGIESAKFIHFNKYSEKAIL